MEKYTKYIVAVVVLFLAWKWYTANNKQGFADHIGFSSIPEGATEAPTPVYTDWNVSGYDTGVKAYSSPEANAFVLMETTPVPEDVTPM